MGVKGGRGVGATDADKGRRALVEGLSPAHSPPVLMWRVLLSGITPCRRMLAHAARGEPWKACTRFVSSV